MLNWIVVTNVSFQRNCVVEAICKQPIMVVLYARLIRYSHLTFKWSSSLHAHRLCSPHNIELWKRQAGFFLVQYEKYWQEHIGKLYELYRSGKLKVSDKLFTLAASELVGFTASCRHAIRRQSFHALCLYGYCVAFLCDTRVRTRHITWSRRTLFIGPQNFM